MLLSRFWYVFLAVTAAAAAGAALLAQGIINQHALSRIEDELRRDRIELEAVLRLEARGRLDRIGFITVDSKLGSLLRQAAGADDDRLAKIGSETKDVLRSHVARLLEAAGSSAKEADLAPDIAFALDHDGRIVAQLGPLESNPPGASLLTYPLVERALRGYVRDDVWIYDRRVYRMAARPVLAGGEYVGAIVHGYKFDNAFAERLSQGLGGAALSFFYGTNVLASYAPSDVKNSPAVAELATPLAQVAKDERFARGERTEPIALQSGGRGVYSLLSGSAAEAGVGYVIARPLHWIASPAELFENASKQDVDALPIPLLTGGAVALALLGLLFVYLERDRPNKLLLSKLSEIGKGERDRLIVTEWRGVYRKLADQTNLAIDKAVEKAAEMAPSTKKKANLDEILGPTPQSSVEPYFGFADNDAAAPPTPPRAAASPVPKPVPAAPPAPARPLRSPLPEAPANVAPAAPSRAFAAASVAVPGAAAKPALSPAATSISPTPSLSPAGDAADFDESTHYRETYAQYIAMRKECGEAVDGLSYEKFEGTLIKTRDQVLSKHAARGVRFTVYAKDGKAALKATPLKK